MINNDQITLLCRLMLIFFIIYSWLQGVVKALSQAMQFVDIRSKTVRIADSALSWIHRKIQSVQNSNFYLVEPGLHVSQTYCGFCVWQ